MNINKIINNPTLNNEHNNRNQTENYSANPTRSIVSSLERHKEVRRFQPVNENLPGHLQLIALHESILSNKETSPAHPLERSLLFINLIWSNYQSKRRGRVTRQANHPTTERITIVPATVRVLIHARQFITTIGNERCKRWQERSGITSQLYGQS